MIGRVTTRLRRRISEINFGSLAAETEATRSPELLLEGFYDPRGYAGEIVSGDRYLILGAKGSGKSAIVQHLALEQQQRDGFRIHLLHLPDLPWADIPKIKTGETADTTRAPSGWRWLILLRLYQLLCASEGLRIRADPEFQVLTNALRSAGLLAESIHHVVDTTTKKTLKIRLGIAEGGIETGERNLHLSLVSEEMARVLRNLQNDESLDRLILAIDGLDGLLLEGREQWTAIGALVAATVQLNREFMTSRTPVRVVLLMRGALFDRLNYAESNKVKHDWGLDVTWTDSDDDDDSLLFGLADHKARVSLAREVNLLEEFFPDRVSFAKRKGKPQQTPRYLLSYTRYTPRDYLTLLRSISANSAFRVTDANLRRGTGNYAPSTLRPKCATT
jgi:hypothetical protein